MKKISVGNNVFMYPMPVTLLGVNILGKPNFMTLSWVTRVNANPPMVGCGVGKHHYTPQGFDENKTFSINFPSADMVRKVDYCGLVSGKDIDKAKLFEVFYGDLKTAPMIKECPFSVECALIQTVELPMEQLFIGEIVAAYSEDRYLTDGAPDMAKINPILLIQPRKMYAAVGPDVAPAWEIGKKLIK